MKRHNLWLAALGPAVVMGICGCGNTENGSGSTSGPSGQQAGTSTGVNSQGGTTNTPMAGAPDKSSGKTGSGTEAGTGSGTPGGTASGMGGGK